MPRQKRHANRIYQLIGEPGPGTLGAGYVRYSSELQDKATIVTQKRRIEEFFAQKGWRLHRWYEEPEQSAKYEEIDDRPVFAQMLQDAGTQFQVIVCYANNRWSRNVPVAYTSLTRLRRRRVWWATADGLWDIDKVQQDGFDVAFAVDTQMNASYVRQLSKRIIDGKEDRARDGYHNGWVPFGYLPPIYPKPSDDAPSTWRPPRTPVRPDPVNFPALVRIGELAAQGWSDAAIADELEGYVSRTSRFGERKLTKDTIAAIRRSWFPREFAPGSGLGTINSPSGELTQGQHQAAWPYELWQRMVEVKASQYHRPQVESTRRSHEFSRIIVCAACRHPLNVTVPLGKTYYNDMSQQRKRECSAGGSLAVKAATVVYQFGQLLESVSLPESWRELIAERCTAETNQKDQSLERLLQRRQEVEAEQKRLVLAFTKGYVSEQDLDTQMRKMQDELLTLPLPISRSADDATQAAISAGETLADMAEYWSEATPEERRDIVWSLLPAGGLIYDLERRCIVGLLPRETVLPVLALGLEATGRWEQRELGVWLKEGQWPPKQERQRSQVPPQPPSLTPAQQQEAYDLVRRGMSLRLAAKQFATSRESIRRVMKKLGTKKNDTASWGDTLYRSGGTDGRRCICRPLRPSRLPHCSPAA
jgi:DNA invertase Pin-like site-specific DNA recombinase